MIYIITSSGTSDFVVFNSGLPNNLFALRLSALVTVRIGLTKTTLIRDPMLYKIK